MSASRCAFEGIAEYMLNIRGFGWTVTYLKIDCSYVMRLKRCLREAISESGIFCTQLFISENIVVHGVDLKAVCVSEEAGLLDYFIEACDGWLFSGSTGCFTSSGGKHEGVYFCLLLSVSGVITNSLGSFVGSTKREGFRLLRPCCSL